MEFILISENKIKVILTGEDLREFELDADELDYSNTDTKRMFWDVLSRAKHSTGFDTDGQKVLVQLYPSRCGGCEMFVTKIGALSSDEGNGNSAVRSTPIISEKITVKGKQRGKHYEKKRYAAFGFDSLPRLLAVCRQLQSVGYASDSLAYIDDAGRYYLFLADVDVSGYTPLDKYSFICEFGVVENQESVKFRLAEHGKAICVGGAVATLARC